MDTTAMKNMLARDIENRVHSECAFTCYPENATNGDACMKACATKAT